MALNLRDLGALLLFRFTHEVLNQDWFQANKAVLAAHFFFMILFKVIGYSGHISSGMIFCENWPRNADSGDHVFNFAKDFGPGCRVCK